MKFTRWRKARIIIFDVIRFALVISCISFCPLIVYGLRMAKGQGAIIMNARPVTAVLADAAVPDSVKAKLQLIQEIRSFAFDSLGLNTNKNYTTFFDQHGKRLIYVVTACEPYALQPKHWHFPVLGDVPYKGFFDEDKAKEEWFSLRAKGYDADIGGASGWSTLGFLKDPILSQMLNNDEGELAELIIHELTHGTIFVKDDVEFNENLASFIGYKGALRFLEHKFGKDSKQLNAYLDSRRDNETLEKFMLNCAHALDSLYKHFPATAPVTAKEDAKRQLMLSFMFRSRNLPLEMDSLFPSRFGRRMFKSGNAFFMQYVRYGAQQHDFEKDYLQFADLRKYIAWLRGKYN